MRSKGFTLIELLIVVAIIAILAAIAVPNFLEAQVRSKVSRVKADQRSLATAIESYYVDNNNYPAVDSSQQTGTGPTATGLGVNKITGASLGLLQMPTFRRKRDASDNLATLTTPISYITSIFADPFARTKGASFIYSTPSTALSPETQISGWIVWSFGPDNDEIDQSDNAPGDIGTAGTPGSVNIRVGETFYDPSTQVPSDELIKVTYDPTNGTTSSGDVYRTKQ